MSKPRYHEAAAPTDPVAFRAVVESRRSVRKFVDEPVPRPVLDDCLDLAMLAPNSSNLQPWEFHVVETTVARSRLATACLGQNAARTAPVLIVVVARTDTWREHCDQMLARWPQAEVPRLVRDYYARFAKFYYGQGPLGLVGFGKKLASQVTGWFRPVPRGPFSETDMKLWAVKSTALAAENLMLALRAHGYDSCPMEGFDEVRVHRQLQLADDAAVVMVLGVGRRADDGVYYPRLRFPRERFVHYC